METESSLPYSQMLAVGPHPKLHITFSFQGLHLSYPGNI